MFGLCTHVCRRSHMHTHTHTGKRGLYISSEAQPSELLKQVAYEKQTSKGECESPACFEVNGLGHECLGVCISRMGAGPRTAHYTLL